MGTRSVIGVMNGDVCKAVYCHWDGHMESNGRVLQEHYNKDKATRLIELGDLSSLGSEIGEKHDFNALTDDVCNFYGRDRGELGCEATAINNWDEFLLFYENCGAEFGYIMKDEVWYVVHNMDMTLRNLSQALSTLE